MGTETLGGRGDSPMWLVGQGAGEGLSGVGSGRKPRRSRRDDIKALPKEGGSQATRNEWNFKSFA